MLFSISTSVYYYQPKPKPEDPKICSELAHLAQRHPRWGFWMMFHYLRLNDHWWNHKRVYRVYTHMKLNLRRPYKKRLPKRAKESLLQPLFPNMTWSMDFMSDGLISGEPFRSFNIIDDFNREALHITVDRSIPSKRVIRELDKLIEWRDKPEKIRVDNGPEFLAQAMQDWCASHQITLTYIQKGKPSQNGYIERFNRSFREEILDAFAFESLEQARMLTQAWMWIYNNERPHDAIGNIPPRLFLERRFCKDQQIPGLLQDVEYSYDSLIKNVAS